MNEAQERVARILAVALERTQTGQMKWMKGVQASVYRAPVPGGTLRIFSRDRDGAAPYVFEALGSRLSEVGGTLSQRQAAYIGDNHRFSLRNSEQHWARGTTDAARGAGRLT